METRRCTRHLFFGLPWLALAGFGLLLASLGPRPFAATFVIGMVGFLRRVYFYFKRPDIHLGGEVISPGDPRYLHLFETYVESDY